MSSSLYEALSAAAEHASALTLRANLIPAAALPEDANFFVLPPTYAEVGHLASPIRDDGTNQYILIESTQSWANRLEELLDRPEVGVGAVSVLAAGRTLTVNALPHRVFDALLRDSEQAGQPFRATPLGQSITEARADNATALLQSAPGTLLFGAWDSFAGAKMGAAKWPAAMSRHPSRVRRPQGFWPHQGELFSLVILMENPCIISARRVRRHYPRICRVGCASLQEFYGILRLGIDGNQQSSWPAI